eukprot:scaffold65609_cov61-Attheya_sp.AAC.1
MEGMVPEGFWARYDGGGLGVAFGRPGAVSDAGAMGGFLVLEGRKAVPILGPSMARGLATVAQGTVHGLLASHGRVLPRGWTGATTTMVAATVVSQWSMVPSEEGPVRNVVELQFESFGFCEGSPL